MVNHATFFNVFHNNVLDAFKVYKTIINYILPIKLNS